MKRYQIFVTGKEGIFDPAGKTSQSALENLGYTGIQSLRIGKFIELEVEDSTSDEDVDQMCQKLLANPVIENYEIKPL